MRSGRKGAAGLIRGTSGAVEETAGCGCRAQQGRLPAQQGGGVREAAGLEKRQKGRLYAWQAGGIRGAAWLVQGLLVWQVAGMTMCLCNEGA